MSSSITKYLLLITLSCAISSTIKAEIKSPNYDFTIATLEPFFPGKSVSEVQKDKTIKSDIFEDGGNQKTYRFKLKKENYILDLYTQTKDDKITDLFVRLPQHFNHDLFLTDLQKRYKKQDRFVRKDLSALYVWMNREGNNILYHGSCSITCFPMFIEIVSTEKNITPLYQKLNEALPKW